MRSLVRVGVPAGPVVSVEDALAQLSLPAEAAPQLQPALDAAEAFFDGADGYLGRALVTQSWDMFFDAEAFTSGKVEIPLPPFGKIEEFAYADDTDKLVVIAPEAYSVFPSSPAFLIPRGWNLREYKSYRLRFTCGYGDTGAAVPATIRQAIVLQAAYQRSMTRDDVQLVSETVNGVSSAMWSVSESVGQAYDRAAQNLVAGYRRPVL